ncbi:glycoside hydrolase family 130 protein [Sinomicrobium soli]|uniref:glycoside hydrolase family 130 protein n=1 Tax=Sinomicrobium sp. N-1-3-6 TaxID=2219864 RepID=UPI000DCF164B|nr:glycoside hydrolase family 130 protein [Sinomicrobium sp. N-1-3-6]RAV27761.1 glycosidase [Sinomicrobium sp. N-1-3-6]
MKRNRILWAVACVAVMTSCGNRPEIKEKKPGYLVPFTKKLTENPVLLPESGTVFYCPVRQDTVYWEEKDVFNPATVVRNDSLFLLYRAEDSVGKYKGTSRIGLAYSTDGYHFEKRDTPVLYPDNDRFKKYEWEGGCEDPRIVEDETGTYYMTYTAYDGDKARLFVATSEDLLNWEKHGSVFEKAGEEYVDMWSKSGSVVCKEKDGRMVATRIDGKYWMYWGESNIYMATSDNLINWTPILEEDESKQELDTMRGYTTAFKILFSTRKGKFDSALVEPGPPAILTESGIVFVYNSKNDAKTGDSSLAEGTYAAGQVITDSNDPSKLLYRTDNWFMTPDQSYEVTGQVNNVCFLEGLARFKGKWLMYYGTADSKIAVAESDKVLK